MESIPNSEPINPISQIPLKENLVRIIDELGLNDREYWEILGTFFYIDSNGETKITPQYAIDECLS